LIPLIKGAIVPHEVIMGARIENGMRRLLSMVDGLALVAGGILLGVAALGYLPPLTLDGPGLSLTFGLSDLDWQERLIWSSGSLLILVLGLLLVRMELRGMRRRPQAVVIRGPRDGREIGDGQVTVGLRGLRALVCYTAEEVEGVVEAAPILQLGRKGWKVDCQVAVAKEVSVPELSNQMKQKLGDVLEHHTGMPVERVDIAVQLGLIDGTRHLR
jgi:uncharacterized alkaline shock family protein YloU